MKHSKLLAASAATLAVALMSSCSPYTLINNETYNNADLAQFHTFRIVTPTDGNKLPPTMTMVSYYNIAAAIREQMDIRGYTEDPSSPLLINIGLTVHKEFSTEPMFPAGYPGPAGPWPYWGPYHRGYSPWFMYPRGYYWPGYYSNAQVITGIYDEGVLTMDFIDVPSKMALYSASVGTVIDGSGKFRNLEGIQQAVQTLFSKFPVAVLPQYRTK